MLIGLREEDEKTACSKRTFLRCRTKSCQRWPPKHRRRYLYQRHRRHQQQRQRRFLDRAAAALPVTSDCESPDKISSPRVQARPFVLAPHERVPGVMDHQTPALFTRKEISHIHIWSAG